MQHQGYDSPFGTTLPFNGIFRQKFERYSWTSISQTLILVPRIQWIRQSDL